MKRFFTVFFALLSACTFSAYAAVVDGTCGTNLTWTLNTQDSTLTISGTGEMTNYTPSWASSPAPWYDYISYIKYVTIEDGLTSIGEYAFYYCSGLTSVTIPNSVTSIGYYAFAYCSALTSITIPNSVTSIGSYAFSYCKGLTSITIPSSVTSIGEGAFNACSALTSITIPNSVTSIGRGAFSSCSGLTSVTIPNSVTSIGEWAFSYCESLTSITIPNSITSIGDATFYDCTSLTSITIPNSVTSIGRGAFDYCSGLTSITIPNSVTSLGSSAFAGCSGLTSVTIGNSVTTIGESVFRDCNNIQEVTAYMPTPPSAASCGLNQTAATLYVPAEYLDIYSNTLWWEDFKEIRAIAQYEEGADKEFEVIFSDQDNNEISAQSITLYVPIAPDIEGFKFLYWKTIDARVDDVIIIQAVYESNTPTAAPEVFVNPSNPAQKLIRNGQVYILHEDKQYTISGQVVK